MVGGSCDTDKESKGGFQEWPQVSYFAMYSYANVTQVYTQERMWAGYSLVGSLRMM